MQPLKSYIKASKSTLKVPHELFRSNLFDRILVRPGTDTNQYEPIKYRLSEIYRQYDIANIDSFLGLVATPHKVAKVMGALSPK